MLEAHRELQAETKQRGAFVAATQLMEAYTANTVRCRADEVSIEDGPFAETKELLIGLYLFECENLEQALDYATRVPHAEYGSVEVRPVAYHESKLAPPPEG